MFFCCTAGPVTDDSQDILRPNVEADAEDSKAQREDPPIVVPVSCRNTEEPDIKPSIEEAEVMSPLLAAGEKADLDAEKKDAQSPATAEDAADAKAAAERWQDSRHAQLMEESGQKQLEDVISSIGRRPSSTNVSLQAYVDDHATVYDMLEKLEPVDGWTFKKCEEGTDIYTKQAEGSALCMFKAVANLSAGGGGVRRLIVGLSDTANRPKWDEMCLEGRVVEQFAPFYKINYVKILAPAILSNRDMCALGRIRYEKDGGAMLALMSIEHPDAPAATGLVRCSMLYGGYIIRPTSDPDIFKVTWTGCVDPGGWLPTWVANLVCWKQGLTLCRFKKKVLELKS